MQTCTRRVGKSLGVVDHSTADYCESSDSWRLEQKTAMKASSPRQIYLTPTIPRCLKKHYRMPSTAYYLPRASHSYMNKQMHRHGRQKRKNRHIDESTSIEDRKSITSYSSVLTVDVSREMDAVNRDIEEIIRRCDEYCLDGTFGCRDCCHISHKKMAKDLCGLTQEQMRILSMKRPPLEKLKDVPLNLLRPRPPRHSFKEKSLSAPHTKYKTSREIKNIVEETDALLRNVYKELARSKHHEERNLEEACDCDGTHGVSEPRPATCLERYLGCQNKCRRIHENRWSKPKWKEVLESREPYKILRPRDEKVKHFHDTNCISEPTTSPCYTRNKKEGHEQQKTTSNLKDTGVNTESCELFINNPSGSKEKQKNKGRCYFDDDFVGNDPPSKTCQHCDTKKDKRFTVDLQPLKDFSNYVSEQNSKPSLFKGSDLDRRKAQVHESLSRVTKDQESCYESGATSLLLDRNMGISLERVSNFKLSDEKKETICYRSSVSEIHPVPPPDKYSNFEEAVGSPKKSGGGDVKVVSSKSVVSNILNKIVNMNNDWPPVNTKMVDISCYENQAIDDNVVDTSICLEIIKRIVELMVGVDQKQFNNNEVSAQYARVRQLKQEHLENIDKEIKYMQDLDFYLKNASPART